MSDVIVVTNRALCKEPFEERIQTIVAAKPAAIVLREKDLSEAEYEALATRILPLCEVGDVPLILHNFPSVAARLGHTALHLPLPVLRSLAPPERAAFQTLGASCHSVEDALEAKALGCTYLFAGHVFDTDCKKGLAGRGPAFLRDVCSAVDLPVYGIGGISADNADEVRNAGADGVCVMSAAMTLPEDELVRLFR